MSQTKQDLEKEINSLTIYLKSCAIGTECEQYRPGILREIQLLREQLNKLERVKAG
jgi:hypothetical protein